MTTGPDAPGADAAAAALQVAELLDRRRLRLARVALRDALGAHPQDTELLYQAARAEHLDDHNADARALIGRVLEAAPEHLGARLLLLALSTEDGELQQAEQLALALLQAYPRSPELYAAYARVMLRALHLDKASSLANEALRLEPGNAAALRARALCDLVMTRQGTESAALRQLLSEHPEDQHALALVVVALERSGDQRAALRGAQQLLRMQPDNPHWLAMTRSLRYQNHWTLRPLWPMQRFGWGGSAAMWLASILLVRGTASLWPAATGWAVALVLAYVVYSWVWPPVLRRWLLRP